MQFVFSTSCTVSVTLPVNVSTRKHLDALIIDMTAVTIKHSGMLLSVACNLASRYIPLLLGVDEAHYKCCL